MYNKKIYQIPTILLLSVMLVACSSFIKTSYQTLGTTVHIVEAARQAYNNVYSLGGVSPDLDSKISALWPKYQDAMNAAISSSKAYQVATQNGLPASKEEVNIAIGNVEVLVNDLIALFSKAGVKDLPSNLAIERIK